MKRIKRISFFFLIALVGFFAFRPGGDDNTDFEIAKNLDIYYTLFRELDLFYVDPIDPGKLVKTSIDKMLNTLDPYTVYIPESKMEDYKFMTTGQYGGIGALIRKKDDYLMIAEPYEGFPAQKSGLKSGDILLEINGKSVKNYSISQVSELLKGEPKSEVEIKAKRFYPQEKTFTVKFSRQKIKINSVPYFGMLDSETGYIKLNQFTAGAGEEVKQALLKLKEEFHPKSLVFDLRGNPGGLLIEAINVANVFVPKGKDIVSTKGKVDSWNREYKTPSAAMDTGIRLVVLVGPGSASASEIVSGSIQDLDRGVILGQRSYGKGLVQTTRDLSYNSKLKVTTAKYYIPSGRCIQALDYSHRNPDGSVGHVPDSLISEFKTSRGRTVYDGGGILPDVYFSPPKYTTFVRALVVKNAVFDFSTYFSGQMDSIPEPNQFNLPDSSFKSFSRFLDKMDFSYQSETEQLLNDLEKTAKKEKYFDAIRDEMSQLHKELEDDRQKDLDKNKTDIKELLEEEICSRFYYQKGRIQSFLNHDGEIKKAVELLKDTTQYKFILSGDYKPPKINKDENSK
ncbi:MAG: S41 family peptidase [Bacteroidales bacterium]|nr:S41 family peptidase [Bacteroidales bacterium]